MSANYVWSTEVKFRVGLKDGLDLLRMEECRIDLGWNKSSSVKMELMCLLEC